MNGKWGVGLIVLVVGAGCGAMPPSPADLNPCPLSNDFSDPAALDRCFTVANQGVTADMHFAGGVLTIAFTPSPSASSSFGMPPDDVPALYERVRGDFAAKITVTSMRAVDDNLELGLLARDTATGKLFYCRDGVGACKAAFFGVSPFFAAGYDDGACALNAPLPYPAPLPVDVELDVIRRGNAITCERTAGGETSIVHTFAADEISPPQSPAPLSEELLFAVYGTKNSTATGVSGTLAHLVVMQ